MFTGVDAVRYLRAAEDALKDQPEKYWEFLQVLEAFKSQRIDRNVVTRHIMRLFNGHQDLILGFNTFLSKEFETKLTSPSPPKERKLLEKQDAIDYLIKIKDRFKCEEHVSESFIRLLNMYKKENKTTDDVYKEVEVLFRGHPDLIEEFTRFLPTVTMGSHVSSGKVSVGKGKEVMSSVTPSMKYSDIDKREKVHNSHRRRRHVEWEKDRKEDRDRGVDERDESGIEHDHKDSDSQRRRQKTSQQVDKSINESFWTEGSSARSVKVVKVEGEERDRDHERVEKDEDLDWDKDNEKLDKELDLSNCESCTPSYRLLPKNYQMSPESHFTKLGASVLNIVCVMPTFGSDGYSFRNKRKNRYAESLFKCEDDRFELDMLLESVNDTIKQVDVLVEKIQDNTVKSGNAICIEDYLTPLNLRCIERIYGDHGMEIIEVLFKKASLALPVISERLKKKQDEWLRCHADFNKRWAEIYAENHQKSLDHRSFYLKQHDSKNLSTRASVAENDEISEAIRDLDI